MIGIIIGASVFAVLIIGWYIATYNGFVNLKNNIKKSWSNINVLLKQRYDEIPNLVSTCKGYMKHERQTFTEITKARTSFNNAKSIEEKAQAENQMTGALKTLFAVAENYPKLQANENFKHLQERISVLENEIADRREFYNDSVNNFNIRMQKFPDSIVAGILKLKEKELFQATEEERKNVKVEF